MQLVACQITQKLPSITCSSCGMGKDIGYMASSRDIPYFFGYKTEFFLPK